MNKSDSDSNVKTYESTDAVLAEFTALRNEIQEIGRQIRSLPIFYREPIRQAAVWAFPTLKAFCNNPVVTPRAR